MLIPIPTFAPVLNPFVTGIGTGADDVDADICVGVMEPIPVVVGELVGIGGIEVPEVLIPLAMLMTVLVFELLLELLLLVLEPVSTGSPPVVILK